MREGTEPVSIPWPSENPQVVAEVHLVLRPTGWECVSLSVTSLREGSPIGTALMRELPIGELIRRAISRRLVDLVVGGPDRLEAGDWQYTRRPGDSDDTAAERLWREQMAHYRWRLSIASGEGRGRRYPAGHLRIVADIVASARRAGKPAQAAVAEVYQNSPSAAANLIVRAKAQGLLDDSTEEEQ